MQRKRRVGPLICLFLSLSILFALPGSALAQTLLTTVTANSSGSFETDVTIPSGTAPGFYDIAATGTVNIATPYPIGTTTPSISVSKTVLFAGETLRVFSSGWRPSSSVTLRLELVDLTQATFSLAQITESRTVRARIQVIAVGATLAPGAINRNIFIFNGLTDSGRGTGPIIVNNNNSSSSSSSAAASAGGGASTPAAAVGTVGSTSPATSVTRGLARTGIEALPLLAAGIATILLGTVMVRAGRRRNEALNSTSG